MKTIFKTICLLAILCLASKSVEAQTIKVPAPSPSQTLKQAFALSEISIEYSRPSMKGRVIFGNLVPYDKIWRTGANASTKITFPEDVTIEGKALAAGTYALYTRPGKETWNILFYKDLKLGGNVNDYKTENEVLSVTVKSMHIADTVKTFTINIDDMSSNKASIVLSWENTKVAFTVESNIDGPIMSNIDNALNKDNRPYFQAASYYYDNGKDLNQALTWVNKATEQNPKAFWVMMLKARIENKMNDTAASIASANKVIELAKEAKNDDYVKMADELIQSIRKPMPAASEATDKKKKKK